jgi:hypothetical protein
MKEKSDLEKHDSNLNFWGVFLLIMITINTCNLNTKIENIGDKIYDIKKAMVEKGEMKWF